MLAAPDCRAPPTRTIRYTAAQTLSSARPMDKTQNASFAHAQLYTYMQALLNSDSHLNSKLHQSLCQRMFLPSVLSLPTQIYPASSNQSHYDTRCMNLAAPWLSGCLARINEVVPGANPPDYSKKCQWPRITSKTDGLRWFSGHCLLVDCQVDAGIARRYACESSLSSNLPAQSSNIVCQKI